LNKLICNLIVAFPAACANTAHKERLPLHQAIVNDALPETVSVLLMAYPTSVIICDRSGQTPLEINQYRSGEHKKMVMELLQLDVEFWEEAHKEAILRLKQHASPDWPIKEQQNVLVSPSSKPDVDSFVPVQENESDEIQSIAWEQLEKRAMMLEQILNEMNEKNYELTHRIHALSNTKSALVTKLGQLKGSNLSKEVARLQKDNMELNQKLYKMELIVWDVVVPSETESETEAQGRTSKRRQAARSVVPVDTIQWSFSKEKQEVGIGTGGEREQSQSLLRSKSRVEVDWVPGQRKIKTPWIPPEPGFIEGPDNLSAPFCVATMRQQGSIAETQSRGPLEATSPTRRGRSKTDFLMPPSRSPPKVTSPTLCWQSKTALPMPRVASLEEHATHLHDMEIPALIHGDDGIHPHKVEIPALFPPEEGSSARIARALRQSKIARGKIARAFRKAKGQQEYH